MVIKLCYENVLLFFFKDEIFGILNGFSRIFVEFEKMQLVVLDIISISCVVSLEMIVVGKGEEVKLFQVVEVLVSFRFCILLVFEKDIINSNLEKIFGLFLYLGYKILFVVIELVR